MSSETSPSPRQPLAAWVVVVVVLLELLTSVGDLLLGPWATMHWEELFNARAGVQFACGHVDAADALQYRTFCGGCTAEGMMAAPFFSWFGPTVLTWKVLILSFHAVVVASGAWLLSTLVSRRAAVAFVLAVAGLFLFLASEGLLGLELEKKVHRVKQQVGAFMETGPGQ